jgi:hypothetical protein
LSNEEKTNDYENFEKGMIYMKILKKGGVVEKRGDEETKSMPHAPVIQSAKPVLYRDRSRELGNVALMSSCPLYTGSNNMGRSPNYGRNSNILIPDPYH